MNRTTPARRADPLEAVAAYAPSFEPPAELRSAREWVMSSGAQDGRDAWRPARVHRQGHSVVRRRVFAGAAVGGLLIAGAGLTTPWLDHQDAFASWTSTPAVLTGTALAEAEAECDSTSAPGATTMLAERRGVFRFLLRTDGEEVFDCLVDEAGTGGLGSTGLIRSEGVAAVP
ncbi:hypothetical protein [Isoptericola cucumis]|uniref:Uncharacterized protein n=1 Tax=Isoptericola cucumis TaxID=1776856 RepID=A0ABQ2B1F2_9MICO|nr:hypothetical protein [Isoptericola cucumis]GGI04211.1 hypothetical protein GCM10007368_00010 [Isoptericola cucumis]